MYVCAYAGNGKDWNNVYTLRSIGWLLCAIVDHNVLWARPRLSLTRRSLLVSGLWGSPVHRTPHAVITLTIHYDQCIYVLCNAPVIIAGVTGFSQILESDTILQFWNISQQDRGSFLADRNSRKPCNSDNGYIYIRTYAYTLGYSRNCT